MSWLGTPNNNIKNLKQGEKLLEENHQAERQGKRRSRGRLVVRGGPGRTCESPQLDAAGDVVIEGDLAVGAVPLGNGIHSLRAQPKS